MHLTLAILVSLMCAGLATAEPLQRHGGIASWGQPVSSDRLGQHRGGTDTVDPTMNLNQLNAKLFNNAATANMTGNNTISDAAFSGANGLPIVIQNSGNNVIIQNGTILNLTLK